MDKYYLADKVKFLPVLHSTSSPSNYYDGEDANMDFYWSGELPSNQLFNLAKRTFSDRVLQWWLELQQEYVDRGDHILSWKGMKDLLRRIFDLPIEDNFCPKKTAAMCGKNSSGTKLNRRSSWSDSITGDECLQVGTCTHASEVENYEKTNDISPIVPQHKV